MFSQTQLERQLSILRDSACGPALRALAAATVSAMCRAASDDDAEADGAGTVPALQSPGARMFGYRLRHDSAIPWDHKSTRSGTITYLDDERVEQYVGQQQWVAYAQRDLDMPDFVLGDQVRIGGRPGAVKIEAVGPNRLAGEAAVEAAVIRSGMVLFRTAEIRAAEIASVAQTAAERYAASCKIERDGVALTFSRGAQLSMFACPLDDAVDLATLVSEPLTGSLRLEVLVRANSPEAALEAECALAYCAALLATSCESVARDDSGAILCAEQLYELGVRNQTRGAVFSIAAAAAQRAWPAQPAWFSNRGGVCDELAIFSSRSWRADFASAYVRRTLDGFSEAVQLTGDPVIPLEGEVYSDAERSEPGTLQRLFSLRYGTVTIDVAFLDATAAADTLRAAAAARHDIAALLGGAVSSSVVIAFGNHSDDVDSELFGLEMRRADALATALAAALARRGDCLTVDASGTLYSPDDLVELALQRRGKNASWNARVAAARSA